jgi:integrase/recombinase XerD
MTYDHQTTSFKEYLKNLGYSQSTIHMLPECISDFLGHAQRAVEEITQREILNFYEWLEIRPHKRKEGGLSEQYINHHVYALKTFFNWLEETNQLQCNPISAMKFRSPESRPREPLNQTEINHLFEAAENLKEKAVLHLFYSIGLRRSEAESLNIKDLHFKSQILYVREGKGAKRRAVPLTEKVTTELKSYYLEARLPVPAKESEAFILNKTGGRMSGDGYNKALKEIIKRTEISPETSLHHLRHSIATHLLERGLSVEYVRDFLGHSHLESTQIYVKVNQRQLQSL